MAIAAMLLIFVFDDPFAGLKFKDKMAEAGAAVATALLVVTLFVERSASIINALISGDEQRNAELLLSDRDPATPNQGRVEMKQVMTNKERIRILLSFTAGLFISAAGIRTLEGLVQATPAACTKATVEAGTCFASQPQLFFAVDVLLTAGLIAGGSNGLATLIQVLKDIATTKPAQGNAANSRLRARLTSAG
ncbi:MAG: hypothetical protein WBR13_02970 [Allosphingosinicella sp.]